MGSKAMPDDYSLLDRALALSAERAQTLETLSSALGETIEDASIYWFVVNKLRRSQGHFLPVLFDAAAGKGGRAQSHADNWYALTWRLGKLLENFQVNEGLAVHYTSILTDPEGGHYELNLAASEVVAAVCLENASLDTKQMKRVCVHACEPVNGIELLVSNAGKILLSVEEYRGKPLTASFIESLYAKLVEGISIKEVREAEGRKANTVEELRKKALETFCAHLWPHENEKAPVEVGLRAAVGGGSYGSVEAGPTGSAGSEFCSSAESASSAPGEAEPTGSADCASSAPGEIGPTGSADCGNHALIDALIALHYFKTFRLFPAGNNVLAYLMYFLILHRAGYHFSAHVPVIKLLYAREGQHASEDRLCCDTEGLTVECDGYSDWTRFFERAVEAIVDEQSWTITKLDGMGRRRERYRVIIDSDETMNFRQKEVLLEASLHSNAEFTYAIHEQRYDVSYPCARSDFARLLDMGFLRQHDDGIRHFFVASDSFGQTFLAYLKRHCSQAFYRYYDEEGRLRDEFKSADAAASEYNKDIGFYEKSLLDKTYIEHYDFRRAPIADCDGPRRRSSLSG